MFAPKFLPPSTIHLDTHTLHSCMLKEDAQVKLTPVIILSHLNHHSGSQPCLHYLFFPVASATAVPHSWLLF